MAGRTGTAATSSRRYRRAARGQPFRHGFGFTFVGVSYMAVSVFVGLAAANSQINLLFLVFGIFLGGLVVSGMLSTLALAGLRVYRQMPPACHAGEPVPVAYRLVNGKRLLASYSLHVRERMPAVDCSEVYLPAVAADQTVVGRATFTPARRGVYRFDSISVFTRFPFALFVHFTQIKDFGELVVFPAAGRLVEDAVALSIRSGLGARQQYRGRGLDEFYGLREYRHGDNPRLIHWRSSARTGALQVKEMSPPRPNRLIVLLSAAADEGDELLEQAISLAASLVEDAIGQALEVGLLLAEEDEAGQWPGVWLAPGRGQRQRFELLRALALFRGRKFIDLPRMPSAWLRQLAGAHCLWITRGLSAEQVESQAGQLLSMQLAVRAIRSEQADIVRMMSPRTQRGPVNHG